MQCNQCGACCIALSISSIIPETGKSKLAGQRCRHLTDKMKCSIYHKRPSVCINYTPSEELCGNSFKEAMQNLAMLEKLTSD